MALLLATAAGPALAQDTTRAVRARTLAEDLQLFSQVLNQLRVNHPDSLDAHRLMMSAINGLVRAADPHSYVLPAVRFTSTREGLLAAGKLESVPITFSSRDGVFVVEAIAPGSAAAREDVRRGDVLIQADGRPVASDDEFQLDAELSGARGSVIALTFERERADGSRIRLNRLIKRESADAASAIRAVTMLGSDVGYLRITTFAGERIAEDVDAAIKRLDGRGMQRLIVDLRDNGGGRVDAAARVAGAFLPTGALVYTAAGRRSDVTDTGRVQRSFFRSERRYPLAVLVNGGSASASELVAGALQDHDRAVIVGQPTFGKALLMRGFPLTDGSVLMLVIGQMRTPCGRVVQRSYQSMRSGEYYRAAGTVRDTVGRPRCRTTSGRVVYGGGGIYPDVVTATPHQPPSWLSQLDEEALFDKWAAARTDGRTATANMTLDQFLDPGRDLSADLAHFRTFAREHGAVIPDEGASVPLTDRIRLALATQLWGDEGRYRALLVNDPELRVALSALGR
jgi:carboxyl-terminal processing protease